MVIFLNIHYRMNFSWIIPSLSECQLDSCAARYICVDMVTIVKTLPSLNHDNIAISMLACACTIRLFSVINLD